MSITRRFPTQGIRILPLSISDSKAFESLYELYAAMFPLADEREPPEEFFRILSFNENQAIQEAYGPYREIVAAVRLWDAGPVVGGHVFGVTSGPAHLQAGIPASVQGIYTFLHERYRGLVPMRDFIAFAQEAACSTFGQANPQKTVIFFEVNNPLRMTADEIAADTESSGLHPARRYMFWFRSGFRPLDMEYVQPRLREDAQPVRYLDLFCSKNDIMTIPAAVVLSHLHAFCSISVLKNQNASGDGDFAAMESWLRSRDSVALLGIHSDRLQTIAKLEHTLRKERP
jgi:hypothetical protein